MRSDRYKEEPKEQKIEEQPKKKVKIKKEKPPKEKKEKEKKNHPLLKKFFLTILLIIILIFSYAYFIEPHLLMVKEYKVESDLLPESFHGLKIVSLGDINYGTTTNEKDLDRIITTINNLKPDIILFTGDLLNEKVSLSDKEKELLSNYLSKLNPTINKYAIYGEQDNESIYKEIMSKSNFKLLNNESTLIYYKDIEPIQIIGFNSKKTNPDYSIINNEEAKYKIVLVHNPETIDTILTYSPSLIVSGHNLNGTINIPKINKLFLEENTTYYKPYYKKNNTDIYITNGIGTKEIPLRINNIPSINLYRLYKTF